jgi:transcriptional antiterminator
MTTIVIKPKNKAEKIFLTRLLKKMNIETQFIEEPIPNYETQQAIKDVEQQTGIKVKDSQELFSKLGL